MNASLKRLKNEFRLTEIVERRPDLASCKVRRDVAETLIRELRDREGYTHLAFLTAIDYIEKGVFTLTYMLHSHRDHSNLAVHVDVPREAPEMTSIHTLWAQAGTYQRELHEMFGIEFPGSPRQYEDFFLEGWDQIPPMRKEFDIVAYSEATFGSREGRASEEPQEHMKQALYPTRGGDA